MKLWSRLQDWYRGEYVEPPRDIMGGNIVFVPVGYYKQPLLAKALGVLGRFWLAHWQWTIGTTIALCGLVLAWYRLS